MSEENFSVDSIWDDSLRIQQSRHGYRFALDAILLAHFLHIEASEDALEIGCGNGVIPILLSRLKKYRRIVAVEIQSELADLARANVERNHAEQIELIQADALQLRERLPAKTFHLVYSNPPYRKLGTGKLNPSREKAIARHEINLRLEDLVSLADHFLRNNGRFSVILPAFREKDLMQLLALEGYFLSERKYVHSFQNDPPAFFLATAMKRPATMHEIAPLIIYDKPGEYTAEMASLLARPRSVDFSPH